MGAVSAIAGDRVGVLVKTAPDAPPEFRAGRTKGPPKDKPRRDFHELAEELGIYWENGGGKGFWLAGKAGVWSKFPRESVEDKLRAMGMARTLRDGELLSEVSEFLLWVMEERRVEWVMQALPGRWQGLSKVGGYDVLVRTSPALPEPKRGDWEWVRELIWGRLDLREEGGPDQTAYFVSWLKVAYESMLAAMEGGPDYWRPGHAVILVGPGDSGKGRLQHQLISGMLGGRSANPKGALFGTSDFNSELFEAEHLLMEELAGGSQKMGDRVLFGERTKELVVNDTQRLHEKRKGAVTVGAFWRLTISVNDDPDKLRGLPPLAPDYRDKVMLFLCKGGKLPGLVTGSTAERIEFRRRIAAELPAFGWWLVNEWKIPEELTGGRFGVKEWHHPDLASELFEDAPPAELLQLIDGAWFDGLELSGRRRLCELDLASELNAATLGGFWEGTALELESLLKGDRGLTSSVAAEAKRFFNHNNCGRLLGRLAKDMPLRVMPHRKVDRRNWIIAGTGK